MHEEVGCFRLWSMKEDLCMSGLGVAVMCHVGPPCTEGGMHQVSGAMCIQAIWHAKKIVEYNSGFFPSNWNKDRTGFMLSDMERVQNLAPHPESKAILNEGRGTHLIVDFPAHRSSPLQDRKDDILCA